MTCTNRLAEPLNQRAFGSTNMRISSSLHCDIDGTTNSVAFPPSMCIDFSSGDTIMLSVNSVPGLVTPRSTAEDMGTRLETRSATTAQTGAHELERLHHGDRRSSVTSETGFPKAV